MRDEKTPVNYRHKNPEPQLKIISEYLRACMIRKDYWVSIFFTAVDVKFPGSVAYMVETLSKLSSSLVKAQNSKLASL